MTATRRWWWAIGLTNLVGIGAIERRLYRQGKPLLTHDARECLPILAIATVVWLHLVDRKGRLHWVDPISHLGRFL